MKTYNATLFHPEGDYVTDFYNRKTVSDVWDEVNDMGSRWIFYPIPFVTTDKTVIAAPEGLEFLNGKRIKTVRKFLAAQWNERAEEICNLLNAGMPLNFIY